MEEILAMEHITKTYPGVKALDDVSISFIQGEVHAVMGENGAGKSTLMKILNGMIPADSGEIRFHGEKVAIRNPRDARALGIAMIHQELNPIKDLTVAENMFVGRYPQKGCFVDWSTMYDECRKLFEHWKVDFDPKQKVRTLSTAETQMLEILKAISYDAKLIIMDEPTSAITEREVQKLFSFIEELKGILISYCALVPFIVTLAGQLAFRGAAQVLSGGAPIIGVGAIAKISSGKLFGVPWLIIITILMVLFTWLVMNYTSFGRYIYATGGNSEAATAAGINVKLMILFAYLYMGICTALAGIMLAARTNSGQPTAAQAYEFDAIIACVLGGCGMAGGVGSVVASLIGALTIGVINNCMNLVGVSPYYQSIVKGAIIVVAVMLDKKTHDAVMKAS